MSIDFNGIATTLIEVGGETYEARTRRLVILAGVIGLGLIIVWKVWR